MKGRGRRKTKSKLKLIEGNPHAPSSKFRPVVYEPPYVKAAVMGSRYPDVWPERSGRQMGLSTQPVFTLTEVAERLGIEEQVLSDWITSLTELATLLDGSRKESYSEWDVHLFQFVKALLYQAQLTLDEVREHLPPYAEALARFRFEAPLPAKEQKHLLCLLKERTEQDPQ